ncbi:MAG: ABC transporter permease [Bacillota bacterium]|nr:ABC transporter permease [Bacillota bacterium]
MNKQLILRNTRLFFRTRKNILSSSLAIIILICLHFMIFRSMYTDNWQNICKQFQGLNITRTQLLWLSDSLMFAAILPIGAVSISLVALSIIISDKEKGIYNDFLVAPINRNTLMSSYLAASFFIGFVISLAFIAFFEFYFLLNYGISFSILQLFCIIATTVLALVFANVFVLFLVSFFKTQQSIGAVGTIIGTLNGFLSGAYIPVGGFGKNIANVFSCLPFLHLTVLSRQAFLYDVTKHTPLTWKMLNGDLGYNYGYQIKIGETFLPTYAVILMTIGITLLILFALIFRFKFSKKSY